VKAEFKRDYPMYYEANNFVVPPSKGDWPKGANPEVGGQPFTGPEEYEEFRTYYKMIC
jgi:hypothetical protein